MLVTKTVSVANIQEALDCGYSLIGENKVQEALQKLELAERNPELDFHFIGHLQTNKIKDVIRFATCIQSIDRLKLAQLLDRQLQQENRKMDILIQVNTSYENSKSGVAPEQAVDLIREISTMPSLKIRGLMTIGLLTEDEQQVRRCFRQLRAIREEVLHLQLPGVEMDVLSMGMSGDLEIAIEEGSTMIRVGSAVFGERSY